MKTNNKKVEDKFYGKRVVKGIFAKTKFGKAEQVFKDGSVHLNFSEAKQWLLAASVDELKYIVKDAREAANAMGTEGKKWNYYHDLVLTAQDELGKRKSKMTRTGSKAKFAFNLTKKVTYLNSDNYPQTYKVTDSLFAKLNLRDGNSKKYLEAALKTGEAAKISRKEAIS